MKSIRDGKQTGDAKRDALARFVRKLAQTSGTVSDKEFEAIKAASYSDCQLVEIRPQIESLFHKTKNCISYYSFADPWVGNRVDAMLSRRDCIRIIPVGVFFPSLLAPFEKVFAQDALALGLNTFYRQVSADQKSELICFTEIDLTGGLVPGNRTTTILADRITISGDLRAPASI